MTATADRSGAGLRFRDLGTLVVERDGVPLHLRGPRLGSALAMLLIHADERVGTDVLTEAMWGTEASPRSQSTLESHVWRLRKVLEPDRAHGAPSTVLLHDVAGYRLLATVDQVDSLRFTELVGEAADLLAADQPGRALHRTTDALALWRGRPFTSVADEAWAEAAVARLEELHTQVQELRINALLAIGDPGRALVELGAALAEQPLRERLWAQRMLASHRSGRTDQALATYQQARRLFLDELGVEPGAELRDLQARILAADPDLSASRAGAAVPVSAAVPEGEIHVPGRLARLVGRDEELYRLTSFVGENRLVTIVGAAGCGKTRLAVAVARSAAKAFPDGVWFVDLTAARDGDQALTTVTSAIGLAVPSAGSPRDALRSFTQDRRMLMVLDNCEHVLDAVAELVDDLFVDGSELAVLATSREPLAVDDERVWVLDPLRLPSGDERDVRSAPAVELFLERLAAADPRAELDERSLRLAVTICAAVDGVPLALELAAARARSYSLEEIVDQVTADPSSLARIGRGPADHHRTVRFAIEQSYRALPDDEAAMHRCVAVVPGPFTVGLAAALGQLSTADAEDLLARLVHRSLLVPIRPEQSGRPSRFAQLTTVRGHAAHAAADETDDLLARRDRWVVELVAAHPRLGQAGEAEWFAAVDDDLVAVRSTLQHALVDQPSATGVAVAARLGLYWYYRGMMVEARHWQELATTVDGDPLDRAMVRFMLGGSLSMANRVDLGLPLVAAGLKVLRGRAAERSLFLADGLAILSGALWVSGEAETGREVAAAIASAAVATGDTNLRLLADLGAMQADDRASTPQATLRRAAAVYEHSQEVGNVYAAWMASGAAANAAMQSGDVEEGLRWSDRMASQHVTLGVGEGPLVLEVRANLLAMSGDARAAVRLYAAARAHNQRAGMRWPYREATVDLLRRATAILPRPEFERAWQEGARLTVTDIAGDVHQAGIVSSRSA